MSSRYIHLLLRLALGFIFLWAFLDKLVGLEFATVPDKSWLHGVSPTTGFLMFGTDGVFSPFFHALAANVFIDLLFMGGLLGVGLALILGIGLTIASYVGSFMMFLIYLSLFPPENNPFVDEHIIYILILLTIPFEHERHPHGLAKWWAKQPLVKKWPLLR